MPTLARKARIAPAVQSVAPITSASLKQRATAIKAEIAALVAARSSLALAALQGEAEAIACLADIDKDRAALLANLETVEAAIPELQQRERSQVRVISPRDAERVKREICVIVTERREDFLWQLNSGHSNAGSDQKVFNATLGKHVSLRPHEIADQLNYIDPVTIARERLQPLIKQEILAISREDSLDAIKDAHKRANAERDKRIDQLARELVSQTKLPPTPPDIAKLLGE